MSASSQSLPPQSNHSHSVKRDTGASSHSRAGSRSQPHPAVESAVTRLLVAIKQLLESLTLWSKLQMSELQVSDVYVRLGNDFNAAVAAFGQYNIDMSELTSVPDDLRVVLEQCLSEDATAENLDLYLPSVRKIITTLLQGLRNKQSIYRRLVSDRRHRASDNTGHERSDSKSSKTSKPESSNVGLARPHHPRNDSEGESGGSRGSTGDSISRRRAASTSRKREPSSQAPPPPKVPVTSEPSDYFPGGFAPPRATPTDEQIKTSQFDPRVNGSRSRTGQEHRPTQSQDDQESVQRGRATPVLSSDLEESSKASLVFPPPPPPPATTTVPPDVTRYSLSDKPVALPSVVVDAASPASSEENNATLTNGHIRIESTSPPDTPPPIDASSAPVIASSLAALKKSDVLERRASKRFSSYNISKMTGGGVRDRIGRGRNTNRLSAAIDPSSLTHSDLEVLTEVDESPSKSKRREPSRSRSGDGSRTNTPAEESAPPLPPLPSKSPTPEPKPVPIDAESVPAPSAPLISVAEAQESSLSPPGQITVFLQVGRAVKKVSIEPGLSFSSLRVLFVDKFSYNPGQDNFPAIYIRDTSSDVMYELEDVDEVKDKCLLSLNIEPLDQIKQHIDTQISTLAQGLKDLRSAIDNQPKGSHAPTPTIVTQAFSESSLINRPSDSQFQRVARRLSHLIPEETDAQLNAARNLNPQMTGTTLQPEVTGTSSFSDASGRIVNDLKTQFDEVQNLRRDIGVMRQLYSDFMGQTKTSLSALRTQTQAVRQMADSKVGGARAYIDSGKAKLDARTQTVLTKVEELQDTVENLKDDVLKRYVSPKSQVFKTVNKDISEVTAELNSLQEYVKTIKPMWKKTWEEELQNIVEEQQFLSHQEEFLSDLLEDHKALVEVFGHVEKVISIRGAGAAKTRAFRPPPMDEGHNGLSTVMLEIRGAAIHPERRMRAIAANQKSREREIASRSDEFEAELQSFVSGKKLKLTGGTDEAERVRQKRNDMAIKAMFNPSSGNSASGNGISNSDNTNPSLNGSGP